MTWVRHGECNRCGSCCKGDPFTGSAEGMCPLFRWHEKVGECTDRQHPYYLAGCNVWPQRPEQLRDHPECSFTFDWVP